MTREERLEKIRGGNIQLPEDLEFLLAELDLARDGLQAECCDAIATTSTASFATGFEAGREAAANLCDANAEIWSEPPLPFEGGYYREASAARALATAIRELETPE